MAWTTPGTATAGEVLTASFWNTQVRDNTNALRDEGGLWLLKSADFSAASTVDITNVFSADYINYEIHISNDGSANDVSINWRLMSGASAETATNYRNVYFRGTTSSTINGGSSGVNAFEISGLSDDDGTARCLNVYKIMSPFTTARETTYVSLSYSFQQVVGMQGGVYAATTSYDGARFYAVSGTLTGRYWVYGLRSA